MERISNSQRFGWRKKWGKYIKKYKKYPSFFSPNVSASPAIALSYMIVSAPKATTRAGSGQKFLSFGSVLRVFFVLGRASSSWWATFFGQNIFRIALKNEIKISAENHPLFYSIWITVRWVK